MSAILCKLEFNQNLDIPHLIKYTSTFIIPHLRINDPSLAFKDDKKKRKQKQITKDMDYSTSRFFFSITFLIKRKTTLEMTFIKAAHRYE